MNGPLLVGILRGRVPIGERRLKLCVLVLLRIPEVQIGQHWQQFLRSVDGRLIDGVDERLYKMAKLVVLYPTAP